MNRSGTKITKYGIEFDSLLELDLYEEFINRGIRIVRGVPIPVSDSLTVQFQCYTNDNKTNKFKLESNKIKDIKYTPDFIIDITDVNRHSHTIYIEAKGFANETFRYRWKLFKKWLNRNDPNALVFLIKRKHNGRVKPKDNELRIQETKQIVDNIIDIINK